MLTEPLYDPFIPVWQRGKALASSVLSITPCFYHTPPSSDSLKRRTPTNNAGGLQRPLLTTALRDEHSQRAGNWVKVRMRDLFTGIFAALLPFSCCVLHGPP